MILQNADQSLTEFMVQAVGPAAFVFVIGIFVVALVWLLSD